eukprot:3014442-Prymnesium_polylepis.1
MRVGHPLATEAAICRVELPVGEQILILRLGLGDKLILAAVPFVRLLAIIAYGEAKCFEKAPMPLSPAALDAVALTRHGQG